MSKKADNLIRERLSEWVETVPSFMPHLSKPQAVGLALWSFGMVIVRSCGLTTVSSFLATLLESKEDAMRERLRDLYREAEAKKGDKRRELEAESCFAPLLRWILSWWAGESKRLALVLDATALGNRFVVLAVSVVYRSCAIPVAWKVLPAGEKNRWRPHWQKLLQTLAAAVPADWFVLVLADRGLYARWLFHCIQKQGWHPFLRINAQGFFRPEGEKYRLLTSFAPQPGTYWCGRGSCFKSKPLACVLLACWSETYNEQWLIVTDLLPGQADVAWYGLRPWIEGGFKDFKRGGWQWQQTRITDPRRVERFWLAIALATLWVVSVGGEAEASQPVSGLEHLPETHIARRRATKRSRPRLLSCFRRGTNIIVAALIAGRPLPRGRFHPLPWPSSSSGTTALRKNLHL